MKCPTCQQVTLLSQEIQEAFEELFQNGEINLEECWARSEEQDGPNEVYEDEQNPNGQEENDRDKPIDGDQ